MARLAIARDVLAEYAKLDKSAQNAVEAEFARFAKDPHPGLRLEKVAGSRDDRIRLLQEVGGLNERAWQGVQGG